jgi:tetratricopeptide (TPR) repeat protein
MKRMLSASLGLVALAGILVGCSVASPSMERGTALYHDNQYASAADAFTDALIDDPTSAAAWNNRGAARLRSGDVNRAIADYNRALELSPRDADIYYNRGNALVAAGQYQDAIADYTRAAQLDPSLAMAVFNRGTAYAMLGQRDAAQADWSRAISLAPDPWTKSAMQRSARLDGAPAVVSVVRPDIHPANVASAPAPGTGAGTVPIARTPSPIAATPPVPAAASPQVIVAPVQPSASPQALDGRALASRAIVRELDGDHDGAMQDLRAALALEPDAARQVSIVRLMRLLETPR